MKFVAILAILMLQAMAFAGVDKPWNESGAEGGALPALALVVGLVGAAWAGGSVLKRGDSFGKVALAAWFGLIFGTIVGLPVACILR